MMRLEQLMKWAAIGWTIAIIIGCAWPNEYPAPGITVNDKFIHAGIFCVWSFLWVTIYRFPARVFVIGVLYGFSIELYQLVMPINRSFEWLDLVADAVGVLAGIVVGLLVMRRMSKG